MHFRDYDRESLTRYGSECSMPDESKYQGYTFIGIVAHDPQYCDWMCQKMPGSVFSQWYDAWQSSAISEAGCFFWGGSGSCWLMSGTHQVQACDLPVPGLDMDMDLEAWVWLT
jgi:hypothetical protein